MRTSAVITLALLLADAAAAQAYVPYRTADKSHAFFWPTTCVPITAYAENFQELPYNETMNAIRAAARTWSHAALSCTYLDLEILTGTGVPPNAANDARNILVFRTDRWCKWSDPPEDCSYDPSALAITSVFAKGDGHIIDADIEVNASMGNILWMNADVSRVPGKHDLQNALTHEMGHFIGLDHTCYKPAANKERPLDNMGNLVPDCDLAPPEVQATTMFDSTTAGETSKRMLSSDDQNAVCETYPPALDPGICALSKPDDSYGCTTRPGKSSAADLAATASFLAAAVAISRRRSSARRR
ncbi:MAG TPA: hypothetical protein VNO55_08170 [Polyangia bacterium]|nr:hypothetical protein [Polyangia bacterium]